MCKICFKNFGNGYQNLIPKAYLRLPQQLQLIFVFILAQLNLFLKNNVKVVCHHE